MSKTDKLMQKLRNGSISTKDVQTLMKKLGWKLGRQTGSHQQWIGPNGELQTLSPHGKDLAPYQIKQLNEKIKG